MVLEGGLPAPLQLYAAAAAQLAPRPAWPPFLPFFGVPPPFLARPRLPHPMPNRAPHGPPSEDSNEDGGSSKGKLATEKILNMQSGRSLMDIKKTVLNIVNIL